MDGCPHRRRLSLSPAAHPFWWVAGLAVLLLGGCAPKVSDKDIRQVDLGELRRLMTADAANESDALLLIDPRNEAAFAAGHLPMAENLTLLRFPAGSGRDPAYAKHDEIIVYGQNPGSAVARAMAKRLMSLRYKNVRWYANGIDEWVAAGLPLVTASDAQVGAGQDDRSGAGDGG